MKPEAGDCTVFWTDPAQQDLASEEFTASLWQGVESSDQFGIVHARGISSAGDAGQYVGIHLILGGESEPHLGEGREVLEERVVLGVFPEATRGMVEVTAIARGLGTFDDMPQATVDLLAGLVIETEPMS